MSILENAPTLIISILALIFTIFSFWWMNWRKGDLIVGPPRSFALAAVGEDGLLIIQIPLIFYNNGAATYVVQNLRLTMEQNGKKSSILDFNNTVSDLASSGDRHWARQFAIEGRKAYSDIFVFQKTPGKFVPVQGKCIAILEAKLYENMDWRTILTFDLDIHGTKPLNRLLTYDNDPNAKEEDTKKRNWWQFWK
jgi:hypothetical protein